MVNRGASRGCVTCRQRRVKCDETKPCCRACLRLGLECAGYARPRLRFKDETGRYLGKQTAQVTRVSNRNQQLIAKTPKTNAILPFPAHSPQDLAVTFFLTYVTDVGRSLESTRGFLEFVRPALAVEAPSSALFAAVNALAIKVWTTIGYNNVVDSLPTRLLDQALIRLRQAIDNPEERGRDATVLAALILQMHATLSAVSGQTKAHEKHRDGALALLSQRDDSVKDSKYHAHLVGNLFHSRVSFCVKNKISLPSSELYWVMTQAIPVLPENPSYLLDIIGVSIASLQESFSNSSPTLYALPSRLPELRKQVEKLDLQLQKWLEGIPFLWYPKRMQSGRDIDSSIETYHGACDIYPSIQIANIWNTWRIYRLILEQAKFELINLSTLPWNEASYTESERNPGGVNRGAQELINSICYSIPFYLGNCTHPGILSNMENSYTKFPSYHDLDPTDEAFLSYKLSDQYVSRLDHSRHVNLHGPLHTISILSHLKTLLSRGCGPQKVHSLGEEQERWIAGQFLRSLKLMNMMPNCSSKGNEDFDHKYCCQEGSDTLSWVGNLADKYKKELWTMTVL